MNPYIAELTVAFLHTLVWAVIARAVVSWLPIDQTSPLVQLLHRVTEPILDPVRRVMPQTGLLDLSPLVAILVLVTLSNVVLELARATN